MNQQVSSPLNVLDAKCGKSSLNSCLHDVESGFVKEITQHPLLGGIVNCNQKYSY